MRNTFLALFVLLFIASCSDHNTINSPNGEDEEDFDPVTLKMGVSQLNANIFDNIEFWWSADRSCTMYNVRMSYDSLVWKIEGADGFFNVMRPTGMTYLWTHSFYQEGENTVVLQGFKNHEMILADTVTVNIVNNYDILGYNWDDIKESDLGVLGTARKLKGEFEIYTSRIYENGNPALKIYFHTKESGADTENESDILLQEKLAIDYFTNLYGEPILTSEKNPEAIAVQYESEFKYADNRVIPKYIWDTGPSKIVLLYKKEQEGLFMYCALAEPNN